MSLAFVGISCGDDKEDVNIPNKEISEEDLKVIGSWSTDKGLSQYVFTFLENKIGYLKIIYRSGSTETYTYSYKFDWITNSIIFDNEFDKKFTEYEIDESALIESHWDVEMRLDIQMNIIHRWKYYKGSNPEIRNTKRTYTLFKLDSIMPL